MSVVHVHVQVGAEAYAVPVAHVVEIGEIGSLTFAPGAAPGMLGLRNLRGELLPVFDLGKILGVAPCEAPRRMLVAERDGVRAGLAVDTVTAVDGLPDSDQEVDSDLLSGAVLIGGSLVGVIDVDRLFDSLEART
jgi:purine-binding chemotaxis protein CheW